jgi:hypothetical protein
MKKYIKETLDSISNQKWFKNNSNYEILVGIKNCYETLNYIKTIMNKYSNIHILMMNSNKGTYITTNTLMMITEYDNLLRFDSDDIMYPFMIEELMSNSDKVDLIKFKFKNFGNNEDVDWALGQIFVKHDVFDWFGGFMPWPCSADDEFFFRIENYLVYQYIDKIIFFLKLFLNNKYYLYLMI